ncbi:MAG: hypothetical protein HW389_2055 [Bacteroidetes bacterium]|nr:hypothetical protein [Bacteroidota bacterium]
MRIGIVLLSVMVLSSLAISQISLSSNDAQSYFAPGKSWHHLENSRVTATMNVGTASSSAQSWTTPSITYTDTMRIDNLLPSATPYASKYPRATHVQRSSYSDGGNTFTYYEYFRITADSMISLGDVSRTQSGGKDTTVYYFSYHISMIFPFTLGKSSSYRDSSSMGQGSYFIMRNTNTYDAFGSLTLPTGTYQALRMKETSITQTVFGGIPFSTDTSVSFTWITKDGYFLSISTNNKNPSGSIPISSLAYTTVINTPTGIGGHGDVLPSDPWLGQNYPNPFNPATTIEYIMAKSGFAHLTVHNALGQEVASLLNGFQSSGRHSITFEANGLPSGVYFYRLTTNDHVSIGKMNFVK